MFPISDSIKAARFPFINLILIGLNIYVFFLQLTSSNPELFVMEYAFVPAMIDFTNPSTLTPFITSMFLHGGFLHIISNMWFLKVFGDNVEGHMNPILFLILYFGSGIIGSLIQYFFMPDSTIPMLGASGAVAGVLGAYFVLFPKSQVKTLIFFPPFITFANISAVFMLGYWIVLQVISGLGSLGLPSDQGGVAFWAHIGGFVSGVLFALLIKTMTHESTTKLIEGEIIG